MSAIRRWTARILAFSAGLSMALVFAMIFVNALRRYTVGRSMQWGEELPIYLTVYGVMFGLGLAYLQDRHIRLTVLTDMLPDRARTRLFMAMDLVAALVGGALVWSGWTFLMRRPEATSPGLKGVADDLAPATGLEWLVWLGRMGPWQAALLCGGGVLTLVALIRFAERLRGD